MPRTIHHIVVGYDGFESSRNALRTACELVQPDGAVTAVNAYDVPWQADIYPGFEDFKEVCRTVAEEVLASAREICDEYRVKADFKTAVGKPASVLAQVASDEHADLVAVGSRGLGAVRGAIGSVTFRLLNRARCPVLVIPEPPLEYEPESHDEHRRLAGAPR